MTEKFTQHNLEDVTGRHEKGTTSFESVLTEEDIKKSIEHDIQTIEEKIDDISTISAAEQEHINQLGGDVVKVKEKTKSILNPLKSILDGVERHFAKIAGVLSIVAGASAATYYATEKQVEKKNLEWKQEVRNDREQWERKENDKEMLKFFTKRTHDSIRAARLIKDLHTLFTEEEILFNVSDFLQMDDTTQAPDKFNTLLDDSFRQNILKINDLFRISPEFLFGQMLQRQDLVSAIESGNFEKNIYPEMVHIRELIPQNIKKPSLGFIDFENGFRNIMDPAYHEALKFIFTKKFQPLDQSGFSFSNEIINIHSDKKLRALVDYFTDNNISFDQTVSWISKDVNFDALSKPEEYEDFFELFNGTTPISNMELQIITLKNEFLDPMKITIKDKDFLKRIEKVKDLNLDFRPLLHLKAETIQRIINNKKFLDAYILLAKNFTINREGYDNVDNILSWYSDGDDIDLDQMEMDFVDARERTAISNLNYFYRSLRSEHVDNFKSILLPPEMAGDRHVDEFSQDPAFYFILDRLNVLQKTPEYLKKFSNRERKDWILRVARNMYVSDIKPTEENFEQVFKKTLEMRNNQEILDQSLFTGRNVALFAHNEKWSEEEKFDRFGTSTTISALKDQSPENLTVFKAIENTEQNLVGQKRNLLDFLSSHDKVTLVVNAHGGPDAIYFTNGVPNKKGVIDKRNDFDYVTVDELALTLEQRFDNGHTDVPILIFSSCYNQDFIRSLYDHVVRINDVKKKSIPMPIMCGSTEYGQFGYSDYDSKYKDKFLEAILDKKKNTKVKDLIEIEDSTEEKDISTNPSLFIPIKESVANKKSKNAKKEVYFQIAEVQDKVKKQISHMEGFAQSVQDGTINAQTASYFEEVQPKTAKNVREVLKKKNVKEMEDNQA